MEESNKCELSSREIAVLIGMRHDNLMRTIDGLIKKGLIKGPAKPRVKRSRGYAHIFSGERGLTDALTLVGKVSPGSQLKIATRWNELKSVEATPVVEKAPLIPQVRPFQPVDDGLTMSSLEIAELTGKRHDNVMRDIRAMLEALELSVLSYEDRYKAGNGKDSILFKLPRDLTETLITGYSVPLRRKVVIRLHELQAQAAKPVANLNDPASLRGLLLGYTEQVLKLEHKITEDAPKVEFYDAMVDTKELKPVITVAKTLKTGQNRLFRYLRDHKILMTDGDNKNIPYQQHQDAGRFHVRWDKYEVPETGEIKVTGRTFFTGKGILWIQNYIEQHGREGLDKD